MRFLLLMLMLTAVLPARAFTVVIDAGHGGKDPGALGAILREKDLNLAVSLRLAKLLEEEQKEVTTLLTRKNDVFLTLQERADFVNKHNADLFICIHANSAQNKQVHGAETYTLGLHKQESNLSVAMRENSVMMLEDDYQTKYQGFNPNSVESYIMFEFMQDQYMDRSLQFASLVQQQLSGACRRADKGVRQAGFWVLHKSACPSVLIELGFLSNAEEEKYMASEKGKDELAHAIYDAFVQYKTAWDKRQTAAEAPQAEEKAAAPKDEKSVKEDKKDEKKADNKKGKEKKEAAEVQQQTKSAEPSASPDQPVYRVQIFAVSTLLQEGDPAFKGLSGCRYTKVGNLYKYTYGEETEWEKIQLLQQELKQKFPDCFITK